MKGKKGPFLFSSCNKLVNQINFIVNNLGMRALLIDWMCKVILFASNVRVLLQGCFYFSLISVSIRDSKFFKDENWYGGCTWDGLLLECVCTTCLIRCFCIRLSTYY